MTSMVLSQSTQDKISLALTAGPGTNNQNYLAAYNAIGSDISTHGGFNPGTLNWFSQAGLINTQAYSPSAAGTYVWNYTIAAAAKQDTAISFSDLQRASNAIANKVFQQTQDSGFVFSDNLSDPINFAPKSIIANDAGTGLATLSNLHPGSTFSFAIWGGTLFARTQLNDPTYFSDNNIDLRPGSRDCETMAAGSMAAVNNVSFNMIFHPTIAIDGYKAIGSVDYPAIKLCFPGQSGSIQDGNSIITLDSNGSLTFRQVDTSGQELQKAIIGVDNSLKITAFDAANVQPWDHEQIEFASGGRVVGTVFDYKSTFDQWNASHSLTNAHLGMWDNSTTLDFQTAEERTAYRNGLVTDGVPSPLSYEPNSPAYDFAGSALKVSTDGSAAVSVLDGGSGFDVSGYGSGGPGGPFNFGLKVSVPTDFFDYLFDFLGTLFSPVILDLDGNGIDLQPRPDSMAYFNVNNRFNSTGDPITNQIAWTRMGTTHDDRFLAIDRNGNGKIDRPDEINFALQLGDPTKTDLQALRALYDTNGDHVLDRNDVQWNQFRVWRDINGDGVGEAGEVQTLSAAGITSISLASDHHAILLPDDSRINGIGSFTWKENEGHQLRIGDTSTNPVSNTVMTSCKSTMYNLSVTILTP